MPNDLPESNGTFDPANLDPNPVHHVNTPTAPPVPSSSYEPKSPPPIQITQNIKSSESETKDPPLVDLKGALPAGITTSALTIKSAAGGADLCTALTPKYIASMPYDPTAGSYTSCTTYDTSYTMIKSATNNRITVTATPEVATSITVTR